MDAYSLLWATDDVGHVYQGEPGGHRDEEDRKATKVNIAEAIRKMKVTHSCLLYVVSCGLWLLV